MRKDNKKYAFDTVMLIDDNEIDNYINEKMIKGCGFSERIYVNTSARSALEFLRNLTLLEQQNKVFPEIIFLDINMPLMDGFTFIEELSRTETIVVRTKIVLLTSSINPEDELKSKQYPLVSAFLRKPLNESALKKLTEIAKY